MTTTPPPPEPTDDEIRVRIAEACGWKNVHVFNKWKEGGPMMDGSLVGDFGGVTRIHLPNYLTDLNACAEAVRSKGKDFCIFFSAELLRQCDRQQKTIVELTARDWANAFLATINGETQ